MLSLVSIDLLALQHVCFTFSGVFSIHCYHFHEEDIEYYKTSEAISHYITFNADTGYISLYPEVIVLLEEDKLDLDTFFSKLSASPYLLKFKVDDHATKLVRRWVVEGSLFNSEQLTHATDYEYLCGLK